MKAVEDMSREELEDEVTFLRGELGLQLAIEDVARLHGAMRTRFGPGLARVVLALRSAAGRPLQRWVLMEHACLATRREPDPKIIDIWVCHARKALGKDAILTVRGVGFALTPSGVEKVDRMIGRAA